MSDRCDVVGGCGRVTVSGVARTHSHENSVVCDTQAQLSIALHHFIRQCSETCSGCLFTNVWHTYTYKGYKFAMYNLTL